MAAGRWNEMPSPAGDRRIIVLSRADAESLEDDITAVINPGFEAPPELQVQQLLSTASRSSNHMWHFLDNLGKTMADASSWGIPVKGLALLHQLLRCGSPALESDLVQMLLGGPREGQPSLDLAALASRFVQKPGPVAQERTALVRAYGLYILERLKCAGRLSLVGWARRPNGSAARDELGQRTGPGASSGSGSGAATGQTPGQNRGAGPSSSATETATAGSRGFGEAYWREQSSDQILGQVACLQHLVGRLVACCPAPALTPARYPFLVGALELVLTDSFDLYSSINYAIVELVERFGDMAREQAFASLDTYRRSAQQAEQLALLYHSYGELEIGRGVAFPTVTSMGQAYLRCLENYLAEDQSDPREASGRSNRVNAKDRASMMQMIPMSKVTVGSHMQPNSAAQVAVKAAADQQYDATWRALFATDRYSGPQPAPAPGMRSTAAMPTPPQSNALAMCRPPGAPGGNFAGSQTGSWEAALDASVNQPGKGQWELVLASQPTRQLIPHLPQPVLPGGFDQLLLDSMYEAAEAQKRVYSCGYGHGGAHQTGPDPFAASATVEPPPYVQMAIRAQQQMAILLQRQLMAKHTYYSSMVAGGGAAASHSQQAAAGPLNNCRNPDNIGVRYGSVLVPYS